MLSVFPSLLAYGLLAPFIIRLALGGYMLFLSYQRGTRALHEKRFSWLEWGRIKLGGIGGFLVLVGFLTQIGTLLLLAWAVIEWYVNPKMRIFSLFAFAMALSLLFSGAGFLAVDLPL